MAELALTRLTLSHFRSHRRTIVEAGARPIAIHGPNGAGKTNLLEAVSLLSPGRGLRRAASDEFMRRHEAIGWKIAAEVSIAGQVRELETWAEPGQSRQVRIDGKAAPQIALARVMRVLWLVPSMDRLWIEGSEGRRRFFDRITLSFDPDHAEASLAYERAMRERNRLLKDDVRDPHWYTALERQMAEAGARIRASRAEALRRIAEAQQAAETAFPAADLTLTEPDDAPDLAAALADGRAADFRAGRTLVGPHRADITAIYRAKATQAQQCSTGEQKALLISLILANARALRAETGAAPILLLDEVAAHLDPDRRAALFDELCALEAQAWLTGTEPALFEELGIRGQAIGIRDEDGVSRAGNA